MIDLVTEFSGLRLKNPVVAAAGAITSTPYTIKSCIEAGAGAVIVKSVGLDLVTQFLPRPGNWFCDRIGDRGSLMHCYAGILPLEKAVENISAVKPIAESEDARIIGSFFYIGPWTGLPPFEVVSPPSDVTLREMALQLEEAGAEAIEVVCTCGLSCSASETATFVDEAIPAVFRALDGHLKVPFWLKLGFNHDLFWLRYLETMRDLGASAMHTYSDFRVTFLDIETAKPPLAVPFGYGRWLRGLANYAAFLSAQDTGMQVISSGGIWSWRDAIERMMCGATIAALESPVQYKGYQLFGEIIEGIKQFMERKGYDRVSEITGLAVPHIDNMEELVVQFMNAAVPPQSLRIRLDDDRCNGCGKCVSCIYGAMTMDNGRPQIDLDICERCGACVTICPVEALAIIPAE
ncbi:MAG: 4Fe-4S binding protein [Actinobacteria bacterium]|nr:4Fe-4S binding protein [Actinomycetota bacterium]